MAKGKSRSRKMRGGEPLQEGEIERLRKLLLKLKYSPTAIQAGIDKVTANSTSLGIKDGFSRVRAISNVAEAAAKRIANEEAAEAKRIANEEAVEQVAEQARLNALHEEALAKEAREEENMLSEIAQKEKNNAKLSAAASYFKGSSKKPTSPYQTPEEPSPSIWGSIGNAFRRVGTAASSAVSGVASRVTPTAIGGKRTHKKRKHHKKRHSKSVKRPHRRI